MGKVTAIDLGSNTFRAAVFDCQSKEVINSYEKTVRTAQGLHECGLISQDAIDRIIDAAKQMPKPFYAHEIEAVTTQALRKAGNAADVLAQIKAACGIEFEIISGAQEAVYTLHAVQNRLEKLNIAAASVLLADIGGGSTEIIIATKDNTVVKSFEIGILSIAEAGMEAFAKEFENLAMFIRQYETDQFACTAGTPTTIAALKKQMTYASYNASAINGTQITPTDLDYYEKVLINSTKEQKEVMVGVGRDDLILAGIGIMKRLFDMACTKNAVVIDDGLREGTALQMCEGRF